MMEMKSKLEKRLEENISSLREYSLRYLHVCKSPSLRSSSSSNSTCYTSRHQLYSPIGSKDLFREQENDISFETMPNFHDKPIFDQENDEDMDACYSLEKQQEDPRHTFERNFTPLDYSYDDILQTLLGTKLIMLPKPSSYGNHFLDDYCAYH